MDSFNTYEGHLWGISTYFQKATLLHSIVYGVRRGVPVTHETWVTTRGEIRRSFQDPNKVAYKTPYKKWRAAAIHVEPGKIEVYNREDRGLVAEFTEAASVEHKAQHRRRWREAHLFGTTVVGAYLAEFAKARAYAGDVGITRDGEVLERKINRKRMGIVLGVLGGITAAVALTKAKEPYTEITHGNQTIRLRVNQDDLIRFEHSLKPFGKTDRQRESGNSGRLSFHEVVAISRFP